MSSILLISETEPDIGINFPTDNGKYTWMKLLPDGSLEFFNSSVAGWVKVMTVPAYALVNHSHTEHGAINFTGTVSADGDQGLTGTRTVGGYKLTFKKGLLVGFEVV